MIREVSKKTLTTYLLELPDNIPYEYNPHDKDSYNTCPFFEKVASIKGVKKVKYDFHDQRRFYVKVHENRNFDEIVNKIEKLWEMKW